VVNYIAPIRIEADLV